MADPHLYSRLLQKLPSYRQSLAPAILAMLIMAISLSFLPVLIRQMLDATFIQQDSVLIQQAFIAIVIVFIVRSMTSFLAAYTVRTACMKLGAHLYSAFFDKLQTLQVNRYSHFSKDDSIGTLINGIDRITFAAPRYITILIQQSLTIAGLMICSFYVHPDFSVLIILASVFIALLMQITHNPSDIPDSLNFQDPADLTQNLTQSIRHFREIRLNGGQSQESQRLGRIVTAFQQKILQQALRKTLLISTGQFLTALIVIAIACFVALQAAYDMLNLPEAGALIAIALLLIIPIRDLASIPTHWKSDQKTVQAIFAFLDQEPELNTGTRNIAPLKGKLVFNQISYYHGPQTGHLLDSVNFTINPGEIAVFTGYHSDEKNLLIDLILRLRHPSEGAIRLDDHPLIDINPDNLQTGIALITGENIPLDETIAGNIAYGVMRCASEAEITAAARTAQAMSFIRHMSGGLQTRIDEKGNTLNKEQLQQLAIARALIKNPSLLILDEVFAINESTPTDSLPVPEKLLKDRTVLIFSQHMPPLKKIDRILLLKNGTVTEESQQTQKSIRETLPC